MSNIIVRQERCDDASHCHRSPIQNMIGFEMNQHWVEVTQDGEFYNVRIDENALTACFDLTDREAWLYAQKMTEVYDVR